MTSWGTVSRARTQSVTVFHINTFNFITLPKNKAQDWCLLLCISNIPRKCQIQALTPAVLLVSLEIVR